jgi:hypothetical protein
VIPPQPKVKPIDHDVQRCRWVNPLCGQSCRKSWRTKLDPRSLQIHVVTRNLIRGSYARRPRRCECRRHLPDGLHLDDDFRSSGPPERGRQISEVSEFERSSDGRVRIDSSANGPFANDALCFSFRAYCEDCTLRLSGSIPAHIASRQARRHRNNASGRPPAVQQRRFLSAM